MLFPALFALYGNTEIPVIETKPAIMLPCLSVLSVLMFKLGNLGELSVQLCWEGSKACTRHLVLSSRPASLMAVSDALSWLGNYPCHWSAQPSKKRVYTVGGKAVVACSLLLSQHHSVPNFVCYLLTKGGLYCFSSNCCFFLLLPFSSFSTESSPLHCLWLQLFPSPHGKA